MTAAPLVKDEHGHLVTRAHLVFKDMPGYPWLPCPICGFNGSCDHTVLERAKRAIPGFQFPTDTRLQ